MKERLQTTLVLWFALCCGSASAAVSKAELQWRRSAAKLGRYATYKSTTVAISSDRLEFFQFSDGVTLGPTGLQKAGRKISFMDLIPTKIIWFSYPSNVHDRDGAPNVLICDVYRSATPAYKHGTLGDFCGIVSMSGDVVYQFPIKQSPPNQLLDGIGISEDGQYAEVYIGSLVGGEDAPVVGKPIEILGWRAPDKLERYPGPWKDGEPKGGWRVWDKIRSDFRARAAKK